MHAVLLAKCSAVARSPGSFVQDDSIASYEFEVEYWRRDRLSRVCCKLVVSAGIE